MEVEARGYLVKRERSVRGQARARVELTAIGLVGRRLRDVDEQVQLRVAGASAARATCDR